MLRFKLLGVDVQIDFWFVAVVTFFLLTDQTGISVIALICCFLHEFGHLLAFFAVGDTPRALIFELTGIRLVKPLQELTPGKEAVVQAAGSCVNFLCFALFAPTLHAVNGWSVFATAHLLLGIFNLLPLTALDGGKLLELFCNRFFPAGRAQRVVFWADLLTTLGLLIFSAALFFSGNRSLTLGIFSGGLSISAMAKLQPGRNWARARRAQRNRRT